MSAMYLYVIGSPLCGSCSPSFVETEETEEPEIGCQHQVDGLVTPSDCQTRPMGLPYMPISWGGFGGRCIHGVFGID